METYKDFLFISFGFSCPLQIMWHLAKNPPSPPYIYTLTSPRKEILLSGRFSVDHHVIHSVSISKVSTKSKTIKMIADQTLVGAILKISLVEA